MPKILITGNGFDLNLNLPTLYGDFINVLKLLESGNDITFESIYSKCSSYNRIVNDYNTFDFDSEKLETLKDKIKGNLWFKFFREEFEIETWIDFENKIEYVLQIIITSVGKIREKVFSNGGIHALKNYRGAILNRNVEFMKVLESFNIISVIGYGFDVFDLKSEFLLVKHGFYTDIDLDLISRDLINDLNVFNEMFNLYFEIFVFPFYKNKKEELGVNIFNSIYRHYTFNYTPTFEKFYGNKGITKHLHGKIDSNVNDIVLGVNDIPNGDVDERYFIPFTKYYQKLNNNTDYQFLTEFESKKNDKYMFFFFGHSLDTSDKDYIHEVFNFVNDLSSNEKKIIVIYHSNESKSKLLINLLSIRGKLDIEQLMRNKVLKFIHVESKEFEEELGRDISSYSASFSIG